MQGIVITIKTKTIMAKLTKYEQLHMSVIANHSKVKVYMFRFQLKCKKFDIVCIPSLFTWI
jgi:hypothetical protein